MVSYQLCQYESLWNLFPNKPTSWRFRKVGIKLFECMECKVPNTNNKGNLYQYLFDRNSDCFCLKISEWDFSVLYVISSPPLFQVSSTEKAGISFVFFFGKTSFYAVCLIKKQNLSMLYAMLRNPSFTSALLIPMDLRMRFPARCVMAPNICSILERVLALVRFPCFSHEVSGCPLHPEQKWSDFQKLISQ